MYFIYKLQKNKKDKAEIKTATKKVYSKNGNSKFPEPP